MSKKISQLRNITLSAEGPLLERARERARREERTFNDAFREWLEQFTRPVVNEEDYTSLMTRLAHVRAGRRFSREELNER